MEPLTEESYAVVILNDDQIQVVEDTELLRDLNYGNLSVVGKIWIQVLQTVLVGAQFGLIPVVHAAKEPEPPKRPPKMRYKELPIYQSPHADYKEYIECQDKCPDTNVKLLQRALFPYVQSWRKPSGRAFCAAYCSVGCTCKDICRSINSSKNDFKRTMRDPKNLQMRQGVVAGGTLAGFMLGGGGGIPRRVFFTSLGVLVAGSLCFPKETDEYFRYVAYNIAKVGISFYNSMCGKDFALRERQPCEKELPPEPKPRKPVCPKK